MRLLLLLFLALTADASAADRPFNAVGAQSGDGEVVVRIQREAGAPACAVGVDFGDGRSQSVRLEEDAPVEIRHRYATAPPFKIAVAGRTSFRGLRSMTGCDGQPLTLAIGKGDSDISRAEVPGSAQPASGRAAASMPRGRRVALLVGNDAYRHHDVLPNSVNDARLLGDVLRRLDFEVSTVANATRVDLMSAIENFESRAVGADAAIFYFSGHGLQDRSRRNFLMPVDARLQGEASISGYGVDAELIVGVLERVRARVGLILLDACRDWPPGRIARIGSAKSVLLKGMAGIYPQSHPDSEVLVQFATREGETADPGSGPNSPYALALAASLTGASSQPIRLMLDNVMDETLRLTGGTQRPIQFGDMRSSSFLVEPLAGTPQINPLSAAGPDEQHWRRIERTSTKSELTEFVERYPRSRYTEIANARLSQIDERARSDAMRRDQQAWLEADRRGTRDAYEGYMSTNREGAFHQQALARLEAIAERDRAAQAARVEQDRVIAERERAAQAARDEQERVRRLREELEEERRRARNTPPAAPAQSAAICDVSSNPRTYADWNFNACVAPAGFPPGISCNCRSKATGINYMGIVKATR